MLDRQTLLQALTLGLVLVAAPVLAQQMYRWTDAEGRVHYSDQPPPKEAKNVQTKNLGSNVVETDAMPYAVQVARRRNPVTLYAFECGDVCSQAKSLLRGRGVPFSEIDPRQPANAEKLKALTGSTDVPVLKVGDSVVNGFEAGRWQTALDNAGYPATVSSRQAAAAGRASEQAAAPAPGGEVKVEGGEPKKVPGVAY